MDQMISNIVFTMNRPLQLEAYLESLYRHMPRERIQTYIIYKEDLFDGEYDELFSRYPDAVVVRETDFRNDFLQVLKEIRGRYVLFGTDDVVYYDSVDLDTIAEVFEEAGDEIFGFSLRLDPKNMDGASESIDQLEVRGESLFRVNWQKAQSLNAKYPFELNSTIYRSDFAKKIIASAAKEHTLLKRIFPPGSIALQALSSFISRKDFLASVNSFKNPNSLEGYCYRWCRGHKSKLPGYLYFQKLCASAIQINRVNTIIDNPVDGLADHTVEVLNEKYKAGYRFDHKKIESRRPDQTHVGHEYFGLVRY